jgi:RimJ/RimL family protein N-acetyltransferase
MPNELFTARLHLKALSAAQLERYLLDPTELEAELGLSLSKTIVDANVTRAINMKVAKITQADSQIHDWLTYWLIIVKLARFGAGLIGFKGYPDARGKAEIGYGIDERYRNQGYVTEALQAICEWAFMDPHCRTLTASTVRNPASERVLQKAGWQKVRQEAGSSDWEFPCSARLDPRPRQPRLLAPD